MPKGNTTKPDQALKKILPGKIEPDLRRRAKTPNPNRPTTEKNFDRKDAASKSFVGRKFSTAKKNAVSQENLGQKEKVQSRFIGFFANMMKNQNLTEKDLINTSIYEKPKSLASPPVGKKP